MNGLEGGICDGSQLISSPFFDLGSILQAISTTSNLHEKNKYKYFKNYYYIEVMDNIRKFFSGIYIDKYRLIGNYSILSYQIISMCNVFDKYLQYITLFNG